MVLLLVILGASAIWLGPRLVGRVAPPIRVGILHSETGPMAISEKSMIDAEILALEEINAKGGLLGRQVEWVIADGQSDWPTFAREAQTPDREGKGQRDLRLLDLGQPQERQAGGRDRSLIC